MQPRHELHLQQAESAFSEALCVRIMFSSSPRAQGEHRDEYEGKAAVLAAERIKELLFFFQKTPSLLIPHTDMEELTMATFPGIH